MRQNIKLDLSLPNRKSGLKTSFFVARAKEIGFAQPAGGEILT
jgi:hypothetical protein